MIIRDILTVKNGDKIYSIAPGQPVKRSEERRVGKEC